jgi:hypothetical protein
MQAWRTRSVDSVQSGDTVKQLGCLKTLASDSTVVTSMVRCPYSKN